MHHAVQSYTQFLCASAAHAEMMQRQQNQASSKSQHQFYNAYHRMTASRHGYGQGPTRSHDKLKRQYMNWYICGYYNRHTTERMQEPLIG